MVFCIFVVRRVSVWMCCARKLWKRVEKPLIISTVNKTCLLGGGVYMSVPTGPLIL